MNSNFGKSFGRSGRRTKDGRKAPRAGRYAGQHARPIPGLAARVAAAAIMSDIVQGGHTLDEKFAPDAAPSRLVGLDERDRGLARSIVTVALRRLGHDPPGPQPIDRKRPAAQLRHAGMDTDRGERPDPVSRHSRSRGGRPRRARHAARRQERAFRQSGQWRLAQSRFAAARNFSINPIRSKTIFRIGSPPAGGGFMAKSAPRQIAAALSRRADARPDRQGGRRRMGGKTRRPAPADRIGPA